MDINDITSNNVTLTDITKNKNTALVLETENGCTTTKHRLTIPKNIKASVLMFSPTLDPNELDLVAIASGTNTTALPSLAQEHSNTHDHSNPSAFAHKLDETIFDFVSQGDAEIALVAINGMLEGRSYIKANTQEQEITSVSSVKSDTNSSISLGKMPDAISDLSGDVKTGPSTNNSPKNYVKVSKGAWDGNCADDEFTVARIDTINDGEVVGMVDIARSYTADEICSVVKELRFDSSVLPDDFTVESNDDGGMFVADLEELSEFNVEIKTELDFTESNLMN